MAITLTAIHKRRIISQIEHNLTGLQSDMHTNALAHKAMAEARSVPLETLQSYLTDCASQYLKRLQWVIDLRADAARRQRLLDMLATVGWDEQEIVGLVTELRNAAVALRDANITTYQRIVNVCTALVDAVDPPDSLWPEA